MAKGKRALFEVLQKDKNFQRPVPAVSAPIPPPPNPFRAAPVAAAVKKVEVKPAGPPLKERVAKAYQDVRVRLQPWINWIRPYAIEHGGIAVGILAACTMIGIVELARRAAHPEGPRPTEIASIDSIRTSSANPSVLQVTPTPDNTPVALAPDAANAPSAVNDPDAGDLSADTAAARPASSVYTPNARQVNLNYLLIQSYGDQKTAQEACDFLNKNGVPVTIEQGIKNWRKDFYLVVGLQGFPRASGAEYQAYRQKILDLSAQFAPPHSYKRFEPIAIKWDKTNN
jgi:hypothetical protein